MTPTGIPLDLGARLNRARRHRGWSIREMARRCNISPELAHQIFTGKTSPSPDLVERLIDKLGVDVATAEQLRSLTTTQYVAAYGATNIPLSRSAPRQDETHHNEKIEEPRD